MSSRPSSNCCLSLSAAIGQGALGRATCEVGAIEHIPMQQIRGKIRGLPSSRSLGTYAPFVALAWLVATLNACVKTDSDASCVNLGGGWHACSAEMPSSTGAGEGAGSGGSSGVAAASSANAGTGDGAGGTGAQANVVSGAGGADTHGAGGASAAAGNAAGGATMGGAGGVLAPTAGIAGAAGESAAGAAAGTPAAGSAGLMLVSGAGATAGGASGYGGGGVVAQASGAGGAAGSGAPGCCHELGQCLPGASLDSAQRVLLGKDTCGDAAALCAPNSLLDRAFVPKTCVSVLQGEGRCLPDCLSNLASQTERLPRDVCAEHEVCAPCFDPVSGAATGSCALGADTGPLRLPRVFPGCCGSLLDKRGLCVPQSYVPKGVTMPQDECVDAATVCVPSELVRDPAAKPVPCTDDVRGAGICVPDCIASALGTLITAQASCNAGEQCYPCQLVGGISTGLCTIE